MWWDQPRSRVSDPEQLHDDLQARLKGLEHCLSQLTEDVGTSAISHRELMQARSRTALSYRLTARMMSESTSSDEWRHSCGPSEAFFDNPELLEHTLSFLHSQYELAHVGAVCSRWYLASRMATLWEGHLRASGRLVGPDGDALPMPHEDDHTLFETAARIERFGGCRPCDNAEPPTLGKIDSFVDDLAAYEISTDASEQGVTQAVSDRPTGGGAMRAARHHTHGQVMIRTLNTHQSRLYVNNVSTGTSLPLARSAHLQPTLQAIISSGETPTVHLVQPATHMTLEALLKRGPLEERHTHAIFCQVAHALQSLHEQSFCHGTLLLYAILIRDEIDPGRLPFALLDHLHTCKHVSSKEGAGKQPESRPSRFAATHDDGIAPDVQTGMQTGMPGNPFQAVGGAAEAAHGALGVGMPAALEATVDRSVASLRRERELGGRTFGELLAWGWASFERLGTLNTGHPVDIAHGHLLADSLLAADVGDLGRLLMRLVLQPHKTRAQQHGGAVAAPNQVGLAPVPLAANANAEAQVPPDSANFPQSLQHLLLRMLHPNAARRPLIQEVLASEWVREPHPGLARPLCPCWKLRQHAGDDCEHGRLVIADTDLRLLERQMPPMTQLNLSNSAVVTDKWLEVLATHHAGSLRRLDLTGCPAITSHARPLQAIKKLHMLEVLRLPVERWDEHDLADAMTALPNLRSLDQSTHADLRKARDDFREQCNILCNVRFGPR